MRRTLIALAAMALAACSRMTTPEDISVATEMCAKRGGFTNVASYESGNVIQIACADGLSIEVRLHWVKQ